ncbi:hypothetical protein QYE77_08265 [Thermanaerothrix sp. 4228-RoL]|uniref:Uncharacterized protein n=1 Tax=Thermanaerothrix solaris TaxID=3058434 RepID=A0ABU3NN36_9CHLR|nr:hypothetical protein [Thermanaerothrix sp. 4228-RoL]MDT8898259.1 hypothetical protein [Thermanaerothrix sp. 4228-RoL]
MRETFFDLKAKVFQIKLGHFLLVIWKTDSRWRFAIYIGHRRFAH